MHYDSSETDQQAQFSHRKPLANNLDVVLEPIDISYKCAGSPPRGKLVDGVHATIVESRCPPVHACTRGRGVWYALHCSRPTVFWLVLDSLMC